MPDKQKQNADQDADIDQPLDSETDTKKRVELRPERRSSWLEKNHPQQQGDVIYVLRTTQQHHVMMVMLADQKANITLGAYLIFLTITQSLLNENSQYVLPVWILTGFFTLTAIFSLRVIVPRLRYQSSADKPSNLLFFGSFLRLSKEEYIEQLSENLQNNTSARKLLMNDIYQLGGVLQKKYGNLRYSYLALGAGIVTAFAALCVEQFF
jgi:hypothetical protein